ncbi:MAG: ABC transporter permease [Nanobdellota archaeon]
MITLQNLKYSLRNLWMRKGRSFLTIFSIFIGIATVFIFISFGWGLYDYIEELTEGGSANKFWVQGKGSGAPGTSEIKLNDDDVDAIEKTRGVFDTSGVHFKSIQLKENDVLRYVYLTGYNPDKNLLMESFDIGIEKGRMLEDDDTNKVILGYNYMVEDKIFPDKFEINDKIMINEKKFRIIGFLESIGNPADDSNVYMPKESFENLFPEVDSYSMIVGEADKEKIEKTVKSVEKNLRKSRNEEEGKETFVVTSFEEQLESFSTILNMVIGFVIFIAFISVIVSAINTANTMITSVLERLREIGIIKSIGAKNSEIFNIFLLESSILGFLAGVLGAIIGWLISDFAGNVLENLGWGFISPHFSWILFAGCILFSTIVGSISGIIPAIDASKRKPVDTLRYE